MRRIGFEPKTLTFVPKEDQVCRQHYIAPEAGACGEFGVVAAAMNVFYCRNPCERTALVRQRIAIIGCGSFGSALADILVRAGAGDLTLIDPELLSIENIGRHILTSNDVGQPKAHALARRLLEVNPELDVEPRQERFRDADGLLVCCADSRRCESIVNAVSLAKRLPAIFVAAYGAVRAGEIQFCVPGELSGSLCKCQLTYFCGNRSRQNPANRSVADSSRRAMSDFLKPARCSYRTWSGWSPACDGSAQSRA